MYCIVLIFFAQVASVKIQSLIGRVQQMDDSFSYGESLCKRIEFVGDSDEIVFLFKKTESSLRIIYKFTNPFVELAQSDTIF